MALKQLDKPKFIQWGARDRKEGSILMLPHLYALTVSAPKSQTVLQPESVSGLLLFLIHKFISMPERHLSIHDWERDPVHHSLAILLLTHSLLESTHEL